MSIAIKYPDTSISKEILLQADKDPEISGFVYPEDTTKSRAGIYYNDSLVGFFTPRQESNGWRVGAIYVLPSSRLLAKGIGSAAIREFFKDKKAAPVPISTSNIASKKAFEKAGFIDTNKEIVEDDGWIGTWWIKKENRSLLEDYKTLLANSV